MLKKLKTKKLRTPLGCAAGGVIAGAVILTHGVLLVPVLAGVVWWRLAKRKSPINYGANAAAGPASVSYNATAAPKKSPDWKVRHTPSDARVARAKRLPACGW